MAGCTRRAVGLSRKRLVLASETEVTDGLARLSRRVARPTIAAESHQGLNDRHERYVQTLAPVDELLKRPALQSLYFNGQKLSLKLNTDVHELAPGIGLKLPSLRSK